MRAMRSWVKLPSGWLERRELRAFAWGKQGGSAQTAALMVLLAIAHRAADDTGIARLPYDELQWATHLSRTKIADGLDVLAARQLILREPHGRSTFQLSNYDPTQGWAMLPAQRLYSSDGISAFSDFYLRRKVELDALKAYFAFAARRDRDQNRAYMTYPQLNEYTGIPEARIKAAISFLVVNNLIVVEQIERSGFGVSHAYRLTHLQPRRHLGTTEHVALPLADDPF
ncbi:hypothetical protein C8J30_1324 [Rhodobacter viridis]|uniref:Helix-turn-helix protein n=1 Tax=Rhodobacter viridis TaxID=1054202 RepID=A0A318TR30_9RHOB|nr:hypothetical protein [Rhodobacter viridis]PYF06270.1 hypothetical protein C8J30_1324 [Rhodobacter viridis]